MKKLAFIVAIMVTFISCNCNKNQNSKPVLRHVVLFEWTDSITPSKKTELIDHFSSLKDKIDVIQDFEYGNDVSVENLTKGYTDCFIVTFASEADRDVYLPHPDHKVFGEAITPYLKNVLVIDYVSKR